MSEIDLLLADRNPYDERRDGDWTKRAARAIIANLLDRRGIKHELYKIDMDIREEIIDSISEIITACFVDSKQKEKDNE